MIICGEKIKRLALGRGMTQNELACRIGVGRGSLSNALSGRRGTGRKTLSGLLRVFPDESAASLINERRVEP